MAPEASAGLRDRGGAVLGYASMMVLRRLSIAAALLLAAPLLSACSDFVKVGLVATGAAGLVLAVAAMWFSMPLVAALLGFFVLMTAQGLVGPNANKSGKGYFKYKRPAGDNVDDTIAGEIGYGGDEVGEPWDAVKQRNIPPDLASIAGSGAMDVGGGDWDNENKEKGKSEGPKSPK